MVGYKTGTDRNQVMMCSFDDMVAPKAMVRVIDRFIEVVDLDKLGFVKHQPADTGCPAYPPKAMCKLYVYGYENGVRSSRKLERETLRNVEVMWLMGGLTPDYKTIAEFRKNNVRAFQKLFREFVKLCKSWELIGGKNIAFDGSKFKASNNKKLNFSRKKIDDRLARLYEQIKKYLDDIETADKNDNEKPTDTTGLQKLLERKELYEEYKNRLDESGENELSAVDPDARLMGNNRGGVDVAYNVQSAVDGKHNIILEYDVSMNPADHGQLGSMVKKIKRKLKFKRFTALADKGYYNGSDLLRVKRNKVTAIVSKQKPAKPKDRPEEFDLDKFKYNAESDTYTCPMGHELRTTNKNKDKRRDYHNKAACAECPHKSECVTGKLRFRRIGRNEYADIYEETDQRFEKNKDIYRLRQQIVEPPFGTVKHNMNGGYFLLRTRRKICAEVALLFLGYNLKRAVKILGFEGIMARLNSLYRSFYTAMLKILKFQKIEVAAG